MARGLRLAGTFRGLVAVAVLGSSALPCSRAYGLSADELIQIVKTQESRIRSGTVISTEHYRNFVLSKTPDEVLRIDSSLPVRSELNREVIARSQLWFDLSTGRYKLESVDQRDVRQLLRDAGLPESWLSSVSSTSSSLGGPGVPVIWFHHGGPERTLLVARMPAGTKADTSPPSLHTAIIRSQALATPSSISVTEEQWEGRPMAKVTVTLPWNQIVHHWADPAIGYRCRRVEYRRLDGGLSQEIKADDFRLVSGVPYPFRYEERRWDSKGGLANQELITVESAQFNVPVAKEDLQLQIPANTQVSNFVAGHVFHLYRAETIDADSAADIGVTSSRPAP